MVKSSQQPSSSPSAPYHLSEAVKNQIVGRRQAGESSTSIAALYKVTHSTVIRLEKNYRERGTVENQWKRTGNPIYSDQDKRHVVRESRKDAESRRRPLGELGQLAGAGMSRWTVKRVLEKHDIKQHRALLKPQLNDRHKAARVAFAEEHKHWTWNEWSQVIWTDESMVQKSRNQRPLVLRKPDEKEHPECLEYSTSSGQVGAMVWGCFKGTKLGPLLHIEERSIKSSHYIDFIEKHALDWFRQQPGAIWMQDNAPIHCSKETTLAMKSFGVEPMKWPAQSPDLNPIENLWSYLKSKLYKNNPTIRCHKGGPKTVKKAIFEALLKEWEAIPVGYMEALVESMPSRMRQVLEAKGGSIDY